MKKILSLFIVVLFFGSQTRAQETTEEEPETYQLPYAVEVGKPIIFDMVYSSNEEGVKFTANGKTRLVLKKTKGDAFIYRAEGLSSEVTEMSGVPEGLSAIVRQFVETSGKLSYSYAADSTGYPLELYEDKQVRKLVKGMKKSLAKWVKKFAKENDISKTKRKEFSAIVNTMLEEAFPKDGTKLSNMILETPQMIFAPTGRELFMEFQAEMAGTRYFKDSNIFLETKDIWQIDSLDEEKGLAKLSWWSKLDPEKHQEFLGRLKNSLQGQYSAQQIEQIVDIWAKMELDREGGYEVDMKTGIPISGRVVSKRFFEGKKTEEIIDFTAEFEE